MSTMATDPRTDPRGDHPAQLPAGTPRRPRAIHAPLIARPASVEEANAALFRVLEQFAELDGLDDEPRHSREW